MGIAGKLIVLKYDQRHYYKVVSTGFRYGHMTIILENGEEEYVENILFVLKN